MDIPKLGESQYPRS